jgi:outer membrane immunogenic protein
VGTGAKSHSHFLDGASPATDWVYDFTAKQKWNAALRARTGLAVNKTLIYVTGGLAFDSSEFTASGTYQDRTYSGDFLSQTGAKNRTGYVFGAGVEHKFNGQLSVKAEYLRAEFGQSSACYRYRGGSTPYFATCDNLPPATTSSSNWNSANDSLRVGVNYRF